MSSDVVGLLTGAKAMVGVDVQPAWARLCTKSPESHPQQRPCQKSNPPHGSVEYFQILSTKSGAQKMTPRAENNARPYLD